MEMARTGRSSGDERRRRGDAAERMVAAALTGSGWHVLARGERLARDELDLVAVDPGPPASLVIVEVRSATGRGFGAPEEKVAGRKIRRTWRGAMALVRQGRLADGTVLPALPWRVDLVCVERDGAAGRPSIRHLRRVVPEDG